MARTLNARIVLRLSEDEKKELEEEARRLGVSVSTLVRTKATTTFAEQVNAFARMEQQKLHERMLAGLNATIERNEQANNDLLMQLRQLLRADEY